MRQSWKFGGKNSLGESAHVGGVLDEVQRAHVGAFPGPDQQKKNAAQASVLPKLLEAA
jgi:hypothetical protein